MKRISLVLALATTMALSVVSAGAAQPNQVGGAAGVVAAVVQVDRTLNDLQVLSNIGNLEIVTVKDSLNNVLQNARFLNNITILQDFLNNPTCSVVAVCDSLQNFLNANDVLITDVVAINVLSGGDIVIFQR
ncbi:MAG TPA: hypothetical protein VNI55_01055 [Gaiellaceae bacterium]|nr:hypothetical protein [Gaiellaceae bacterium]